MRNANDGISTARINDGYHQQICDSLRRLREIAVQLGSGLRRGNHGADQREYHIVSLATATGAVVDLPPTAPP